MGALEKLIEVLPWRLVAWLCALSGRATAARVGINRWLADEAAGVQGRVLATGAGSDSDHQGRRYRDYFPSASRYLTSDVDTDRGAEMLLDLRSMPEIEESSYDCVLCLSVLEHVDDPWAAIIEIHRVLKPGGALLLAVPFRQAIHDAPQDFWRFTIHGIRHLLEGRFELSELREVDADSKGCPAVYCVRAEKTR